MIFTAQTACFTKNSVSAEKFMNIDIKNVQQYTLTEFDEWKKWTAESKCFDYEQKSICTEIILQTSTAKSDKLS